MLNIKFVKSAYKLSDFPTGNLPELLLCGRSNVGKSSFINSISKKKGIAKTSSTPGKTRSLNYYSVEDKFHIVDLPGYGYAKVPVKAKQSWQKLISMYIMNSRNISLAFHIIDSRHPATELDILLNSMLLDNGIPYTIILSKIDKLNQSSRSDSLKNIKAQFPELSYGDNLFIYSSLKGIGKREIEARLSKLFL